MDEILSTSRQNVRCRVWTPEGLDPTADVVAVAFTRGGASPVSGDWRPAQWEPVLTAGVFVARCLVGSTPGTGVLATGVWQIFVRVTDNPEAPEVPAGYLKVI